MTRQVAVALVCTFVALVAATLWVPTSRERFTTEYYPPDARGVATEISTSHIATEYRFVLAGDVAILSRMRTFPFRESHIRWRWLGAELLAIATLGGLLALVLRTRQARGAA